MVSRFVILENAQEYATQLDPKNINFYETGFNLCIRVIELPRNYASSANSSAFAEGVVGQFSSNKYSRQSAARNSREKMAEANRRLEEIAKASKIIEKIRQKYVLSIEKIDSNHHLVKKLKVEIENKIKDKKEVEKINYQVYTVVIIFVVLCLICQFLPPELSKNPTLLIVINSIISIFVGPKIGKNLYLKKNN